MMVPLWQSFGCEWHGTISFSNIPQGHDASLVDMSLEKALTHTNKHQLKTKTSHEDIFCVH